MGRRTARRANKAAKGTRGAYLKFRTRWRHVLLIDEQIRCGRAPNCRQLADKLEVCRRTILRDIDFLRYDLGAPVEYDAARGGYVYTEANWVMPSVRITEGEVFALMVAEKALEAYRGTPWAQRLAGIFERITAALPDRIEVAPREMLARVSFDADAPAIVAPDLLTTLAEAVSANRVLRMSYRPLGRPSPRRYELDPYMLRRARGAWYLIAREHRSGRVPMFNVCRIEKVEPTGATFDYDAAGFDPKAYFAATFGVHETSQRHRVVVEFTGWAAQLVRERQWHASQKLTDLPDGRLRFEVEVAHLDDIWPWVLSWGRWAKAIGPKELVQTVRDQAAQTARQYARLGASRMDKQKGRRQ